MKSTTYALIAVAAIAAFALLREHWSHVAGYWPYLLLVCPLMHLSTATEAWRSSEVKTIKINPADGAASRSRYQSVSFVVSGMRKGMLFESGCRNARELTGLLLMTSS